MRCRFRGGRTVLQEVSRPPKRFQNIHQFARCKIMERRLEKSHEKRPAAGRAASGCDVGARAATSTIRPLHHPTVYGERVVMRLSTRTPFAARPGGDSA